MVKTFVAIVGVVFILAILWSINRFREYDLAARPEAPTPSPITAIPKPRESIDIQLNNTPYRIAWILVHNPTTISLIPNFTTQLTTQKLRENEHCNELVSGGFYTPNNEPIGLFVIDGNQMKARVNSFLLNGFFSVFNSGVAIISSQPPSSEARIALQSGPLIIDGGTQRKLAINNDEPARRIVAATTDKGEVIFMTIYDPSNPYSGPLLSEVPKLVDEAGDKTDLHVVDALNLDGGSASAFSTDGLFLQELTSVGSFFCVKD